MDYRFEEVQPLRFAVYDVDNSTSTMDDDDFLGAIECTLAEVCDAYPPVDMTWHGSVCLGCEWITIHTSTGWGKREEVKEERKHHCKFL